MRLLLICELFVGGGLETQIVSTLRNLRGKNLDVYLSTSPGYNKELLNGVVDDILELDFLNLHSQSIVSSVEKLVEFIESHGIDLVHIHPYYTFWAGYLAAISAGKPFVCTLHSPHSFSPEYGLAYHVFQRHYVFSHSSAVFAVSSEMRRCLDTDDGSSIPRIVLLPNAVDTDHFRPAKRSTSVPAKRIAVISRLDHRKISGIRDWLSFFEELRDVVPSLSGVIAGDGPEKKSLEHEVRARGLADTIQFAGYTNDVHSIMESSDLVVGMGHVVLEGAAMNIPVVLAGYDDVKGLVDVENFQTLADANFSGRGFRKHDREVTLHAIRACLESPAPKYQLRKLVLQNHNARTAAEAYWEVLQGILQDQKSHTEAVCADARLLLDNLRDRNISLLDPGGLLGFFLNKGLPHRTFKEHLEQLTTQLLEKKREAEQLTTQLAEKKREIEQQDHILEIQRCDLARKDARIADLGHTISKQSEELDTVNARNVELGITVKGQAVELEALNVRGADFEKKVTVLESGLFLAREHAANVQLELQKVLALRSYRIMEPVRRIYWHARHVRDHARALQRKVSWKTWEIVRSLGPRITPSRLKWTARAALQWHNLRRKSSTFDAELKQILAEHRRVKAVVIYPPTLDWQFMFQRPQQLARALARAGYLFLYCTDNTRLDHVEGFQHVEKNLFVCNVPWKTFAVIPHPVVLVTWAVHRPLISAFKHCTVIYDCLDDPEVGATPREEHEALLQSADFVLATSGVLFDRIRITRPDAVFCPNGVDYDSFAKARISGRIPEDLQRILDTGRQIAGYHGALARWFDYELLAAVAREMGYLEFVLLGVDYDGTLKRSGLLERANVHWLGLKKYEELPDYLRWFNAGTVPFRINSITEATSPIKLWEYLAAGIPVVSTDLPMCRDHEGVFVARDVVDFCVKIEEAVKARTDDTFRDWLQQAARENTWDARAAQINATLERGVNGTYKPKALGSAIAN